MGNIKDHYCVFSLFCAVPTGDVALNECTKFLMNTFEIYRYPIERRFVVIAIENSKLKLKLMRNNRMKLRDGRHVCITSLCIAK